MAFTLNVANYGTASGISLAASGTPDLVVACFTCDVATLPTSVQYGGVAMTQLTHTTNGAQGVVIFYLVAGILSGTQSITYTLAGAHRCWGGAFDVASGRVAAFDVEGGTTGTSTGPSQAITPNVQPNVIIAACAHEGASIMTAKGTGQVGMETGSGDGFFDEGTWNSAATYEATTSVAANTQTFTNGASDTWSLRVAVFKEVTPPTTLTADSGNVPISGTAATPRYHREVNAESGSVAITGTAATVGRKLPLGAASANVPITGTDATLTYIEGSTPTLTADPGSIPITGTAATVGRKLPLAANSANVAISGTVASLEYNREVNADPGSVPIAGTVASLERNRFVDAQSGSVPITGTASTTKTVRKVSADSGAVAITGTAATLTYEQPGTTTLTADPGAVPIAGTVAQLLGRWRLSAQTASVPISGAAAALSVGMGGEMPGATGGQRSGLVTDFGRSSMFNLLGGRSKLEEA